MAKKGGERKNMSEVYSGQRLMITAWIATITFFSTRGRCFTKAIAQSKAIETGIILSIVDIKKELLCIAATVLHQAAVQIREKVSDVQKIIDL